MTDKKRETDHISFHGEAEHSGIDTQQIGVEHGGVDYERRDANAKTILLTTFTLVAVVVGLLIWLNEYFISTREETFSTLVFEPESLPLRELRAREDEILNSYKVIDAQKGIYQIPVSRSMELIVEEAYKAQKTEALSLDKKSKGKK